MLKFQGKIALITGSGTGIGKAIAKKFVENGASVIILGRRREPLEEAAKELNDIISKVQSNGKVTIFDGVDVSDEDGINGMFDELQKSNVNVDVVVNNAGVSGPVTCFANSSLKDFRSTVDIHLTGTFWTSVQSLRVMKKGAKIITISTFFTEERPLEQRPYRFRDPYTASQGAKNRLAEAMSWELTEKGIISIATNPGPVHSDRIYKTVYPKAAAEFLRVSGFEDLTPVEVESVNNELFDLLGEDDATVKAGIVKAAENLVKRRGGDVEKSSKTIAALLSKIQTIAEKVQTNTSKMIADEQFLSQEQVAETVLKLSEDKLAAILNGKVIPGDRVFYPVRAHIANKTPGVHQPDWKGKTFVFTINATEKSDADRAEALAAHVEKNGGKAVCIISNETQKELQESISGKFHSHVSDLKNPEEIKRWLEAAKNMGEIAAVVHLTGNVPNGSKYVELSRKDWDNLVDKFINTPATVIQQALEHFVPGGGKDPRLFQGKKGTIVTIGPDLPVGRKISGEDRARVEVFRGALRPFTTTINQELSDVLKSNVRSFLVLPGTVDGGEPNVENISQALNFFVSDSAAASSEVTFCVDESR
ncbi:MAG: SDR family NAD(P)-dependent oxidoreductase [Crenarchaeota archaeon]|nr:MAG: SDR family NAD(P)-dependent oxidoreductase [Thermoproteota archaeon]RDJ32816.1 MAG: SDR family NAD(P)-dependent oxidoreductase [Thermoproteota archaeon]RDJ37985.1 MAG: SDR family NAD(P)-dependent oxidoreductase [Thermoproteota archaeon]RDJ38351.1 MAG: SDR family NAD(P)-dependent oxidoreductase [Thermoproteota archaeon]